MKESFDTTFFLKYICSQISHLPLEVLWTLHTHNVMTLDVYLQHKVLDSSVCQDISSAIIRLCNSTDPDTLEKRKDIVKVIFGVLVNEAFPLNSNQLSFSVYKEAQKILDLLISSISELNENETLSLLPIELAAEYKLINRDALHKTCVQQLTFLLGHKPSFTVSDAIKNQDQWTYSKLSPLKKALFKQFLIVLDANCVLNIIKNILESEEFNWKCVLSFAATYLICFREAPALLKNYINDTLKYGIDSAEIDSTIIAFLFARQGCYEGPYVFGTYPDWFEFTFGSPTKSLANTRKSFTFLIKFLSDLVPYESAIHLKAHLIKPPFIPALCKPIFAEYSTLAKTRLSDLKQPLSMSSVFLDSTDEIMDKKMKTKEAAEDVAKAVASYASSGKIPASVMEATIFRRPYFVGYFLPALLQPRALPQKPDVKMKFIKTLKDAGKIPLNIYNNYIKACKEQIGSFKIDSVPMDEGESKTPNTNVSLIEKLQLLLDQFVEAVNNPCSTPPGVYGNKISECLSLLSECLKMVSPEWNSDQTPVTTCNTIVLDLKYPSLEEKHIQVVECLLNAASQAFLAVYTFSQPDYTWAFQFMQSLSVHVMLLPAFFFSLWRLALLECDKLSDEQVISLGGILSHVALCSQYLPQVRLEGHAECKELKGDFCKVLWESLLCSNQKQMRNVLKLSSAFLKTTFYSLSELTDSKIDFVPEHLVKKFVYLCERLYPETRFDANSNQCWREEVIIYKSDAFAVLKNKYQLTLKDWLSLELSVDPEWDSICLRERRLYQNWMLLQYQNLEEDGQNVREICSTIFRSLLDAIFESSNEQKFQNCSKCHQDFAGQKNKFRNKHEIFLILQKSLKQLMVQNQEDSNQVPWLLKELVAITNIDSCPDKQRVMVNALIGSELMLGLPAHLLFTDCSSVSPSESAVNALITIINTVLKDHLNEGFSLSNNFTLHIFQGLVSVKDILSPNCLQRLVHSCPLLWSSFLIHGESWGYSQVFSDLDSNNLSKMLRFISILWEHKDWWKDKHLIAEIPVYLCAASLASIMTEQNVVLKENELQHLGKEISCASFVCLLSKVAQYILNYRTVPPSLLKSAGQMLITSPWLFLSLSKEPVPSHLENTACILPVSSLTFRCIVVFRVLMEGCDLKSVSDLMCNDSFLGILLEFHQEITELYDKTEGPKKDVLSEHILYCSHLKPLTMHDILNVAGFVKKIISGVSLHALQQTNPKIWQSSDLDIQQVFKERLQGNCD